ncbi:MAG: sigma-70 family RNA polymerase sigma factor [Sandaracinaceae bacterium]|nr:sigma-70 family RNA polymerase sigma factor [Sandaracinaceae bacterium]
MLSSATLPAITANSSIDAIVASVCFTRRMDAVDPLILRAQAGEESAFRELFLRHRGDVSRVVFRVLGPSPDVDDVTQDVFIHVYRSLKSFRGDSKFSTWLYRLTINVARMHLRKARSRPQISDAQVPEAPRAGEEFDGPDESLERSQRVKALYRLVEGLSDKKRAVLVLHDLEGVPAKQIAEIVEAPVLTVRTRLFYARKELYAAIAQDPALAPLLEEFKGLLSSADTKDEP